ncbi:MAG: pre-peptidase C-terminal domain-containing protein, partial [Bacteroidota bacterium]
FIDFDGQTVVAPYWNGGNPIFCAPAELTNAQMIRVFNQVAEDYRPFNLNITTDSAVYFAAPITRRQRIVVTPTSSWYGSAGGVAYVESFRWGLEIPGFVFSTLLGNNDKRVAEATSHETGHTLGLYHQSQYNSTCGFVNEYNPGLGSGEISWAPIMGNSYARNITVWHNGPNSFGCNNLQNDLAIIASSMNGFGYRTDDVGNTTAAAGNISFSGNDYAVSGFVNGSTDVDLFKVSLPKDGRFTLNGKPFAVARPLTNNPADSVRTTNIDLQLSLLNNSGATIATFNPSTSVNATIDSNLTAGTYYIRVASTSNANASNYGMLGNYAMTGTFFANGTLPVYSLTLNGSNNKG